MLELKKIAITGGVASGKTTVCQLFQKLGAYVVSADAIAHELLDPNTDLGRKIINLLGDDLLQNRQKIADKVFRDPKKLHELEQILHPEILQRIEREYESAKRGNYTLFVVEMPLLFEIGAESSYDAVVAVVADESVAKGRFKDYERRMSRQWPVKKKAKKAHYVITNNGSLKELEIQVKKLNTSLTGVSHP